MGSSRVVPPADRVASPGFVLDDPSQQVKLVRLLGGSGLPKVAVAPSVSERFTLAGVISSFEGQGAALISVDGQPARPFAIGMQIVSGYVLKAVGRREAMLAENVRSPAAIILSLPVAGQAPSADTVGRAAPSNFDSEPLAMPLPSSIPGGTPSSAPSVLAPLGSPAAPLPQPSEPPVSVPGVNPETGRTGPPPRADMRRQSVPPSR